MPIPGMRKEERVVENLGAANVTLTAEEYGALNAELANIKIYGTRDGKDIAKMGTVPTNVVR